MCLYFIDNVLSSRPFLYLKSVLNSKYHLFCFLICHSSSSYNLTRWESPPLIIPSHKKFLTICSMSYTPNQESKTKKVISWEFHPTPIGIRVSLPSLEKEDPSSGRQTFFWLCPPHDSKKKHSLSVRFGEAPN